MGLGRILMKCIMDVLRDLLVKRSADNSEMSLEFQDLGVMNEAIPLKTGVTWNLGRHIVGLDEWRVPRGQEMGLWVVRKMANTSRSVVVAVQIHHSTSICECCQCAWHKIK